jgi:hypothetical protein
MRLAGVSFTILAFLFTKTHVIIQDARSAQPAAWTAVATLQQFIIGTAVVFGSGH